MKLTDWNDLHKVAGIEAVRRQFDVADLSSGKFGALRQLPGHPSDDDEPPLPVELPPDSKTCASNAGAEASYDPEWQSRMRFYADKQGNFKGWMPTVDNMVLILANDKTWREALGYCSFSYRIIKHRETIPGCRAGEWSDADTSRLEDWLGHHYRIDPSKDRIISALVVVAQHRSFHPVVDYLESLTWDGVDRLDLWLEDALGAVPMTDSRYLAAAGRLFLIGAVARVVVPSRTFEGVKMDNVLILEGRQGAMKSTIVHILFGDWYSDAPMQLGSKDSYQNIQGVWGCEQAELDAFNKAESTTAKLFYSQIRDRFRPSYGRMAQDFPRQCVFIGTTNQDEYLKDYTGNRRYWPVRCGQINTQWVIDQRDQLWAEAMHLFESGARWWPGNDVESLFLEEQDARLQLDPWHYKIEDYLRSLVVDFVTADEIINEGIKKETAQVTRADQNRVAPIIKAIGWVKGRKVVLVGKDKLQRHGYLRPKNWQSKPLDLVQGAAFDE